MSERITEADLRDIELKASRFRDGACGEVVTLFAACCEDLVANVRQLRGLVVALDSAMEEASSGRIAAGERIVFLAETVPAIFAGARVIREETTPSLDM
jgi:hypothetical protein